MSTEVRRATYRRADFPGPKDEGLESNNIEEACAKEASDHMGGCRISGMGEMEGENPTGALPLGGSGSGDVEHPQQRDTVLLDVRNAYETSIGHFR